MTLTEKLNQYSVILASQSPRRQTLLKELNFDFNVVVKEVDEVFPSHLVKEEIPVHLAKLKASAFDNSIHNAEMIITADTIVWINNSVLGKPTGYDDAFQMLKTLSGNMHTVYTGVCIKTVDKSKTFWASTNVYFRDLENSEVEYYLNNYKPYDKAGSYGIQEWIGYVGIEKIEGSYFNVMGLPVQQLYHQLMH